MNFQFLKKINPIVFRNCLFIISITLPYFCAQSQIVANGLVLHLDASNPSSYDGSGTQWDDISGNGNHVTMQNAGSISYDSSNKFFNTGANGYFSRASGTNIPAGNSNYTMIVYVNQPQWQDGNGFISIGGFGSGNRSNALRIRSGGLGNLVHYWWGNDMNVNSNQASLNNWLYIVAKFDGTTRSVWVNGVLAGQDTPSGHNVNSSLIQISKTYGSEYQRGKIKVAMIYNRALSSNELSQNYTAITNPNSAPTDITLSSISFNENIASASTVATLSATDPDSGNTHTFSLASSGDDRDDDNGSFTINGNNLKINSSPNYESKSSYKIYLNVSDGSANYAKAFTLSVSDLYEAPPTDLSFVTLSVPTNGLVAYLDSANPDSYSGSGNTWNDLSGNGNNFTLYNSPTFDANTNGGVLNFDESNDYAKSNSNSLLNNNTYTKIAFFYPESGTRNIISGGNDAGHAFWMKGTSTTIYSGHNSSWERISHSPGGSMLNNWHFGAVTFSNASGWKM